MPWQECLQIAHAETRSAGNLQRSARKNWLRLRIRANSHPSESPQHPQRLAIAGLQVMGPAYAGAIRRPRNVSLAKTRQCPIGRS